MLRSFFRTANSISVIFKLGYLPEKDEYYELTPDQYRKYYQECQNNGDRPDEKVYMLLPKDPKKYNEIASDEVFVITESEIEGLDKANEIIEKYCRADGKTFESYEEKLFYAASQMPDVFSAGTKFAFQVG